MRTRDAHAGTRLTRLRAGFAHTAFAFKNESKLSDELLQNEKPRRGVLINFIQKGLVYTGAYSRFGFFSFHFFMLSQRLKPTSRPMVAKSTVASPSPLRSNMFAKWRRDRPRLVLAAPVRIVLCFFGVCA